MWSGSRGDKEPRCGPACQEPAREEWRRRHPPFPRLLSVLEGTGPAGVQTRISAPHAATADPALSGFPRDVPVLTAPLADLLQDGPSEPVWHPVQDPDSTVSGSQTHTPQTPHATLPTAPAHRRAAAAHHPPMVPSRECSRSQRCAAT
ncbi:hypothetical protein [Streptomyces sp. JNUCC 63]